MTMDAFERLSKKQPPCFRVNDACDSDVAISTRIRLARNLVRMPFPVNSSECDLLCVRDSVLCAMRAGIPGYETHWLEFRMHDLSEIQREFLYEQKLISKELNRADPGLCLSIAKNEQLSVMINEEDHLRIQGMDGGFCLKPLWKSLDALEDDLSARLAFAYDEELGYLTSCPTNFGTGLRASVMLHLPGLVLVQQDKQILNALSNLRLTVRGYYGEGSSILGHLYQISNQVTLGESEEEILLRLQQVVSQLILSERDARSKLLEKQKRNLLDLVWRAYGIVKYARSISIEEAFSHLLTIRFGICLGILDRMTLDDISRMLLQIQPAHIQYHSDVKLSASARDGKRADILRDFLNGTEQ